MEVFKLPTEKDTNNLYEDVGCLFFSPDDVETLRTARALAMPLRVQNGRTKVARLQNWWSSIQVCRLNTHIFLSKCERFLSHLWSGYVQYLYLPRLAQAP